MWEWSNVTEYIQLLQQSISPCPGLTIIPYFRYESQKKTSQEPRRKRSKSSKVKTHYMIFRFLQNRNISENLRMDWVRRPSMCRTLCSAPRTTPWWWPTGAPPPPCAARWSRTRSTEWWVVRRLEYILGHGSHSHILSWDAMSDRTLVGKGKYIIQYIITARIPGKDILLSHQCLLLQQIILRPEPL